MRKEKKYIIYSSIIFAIILITAGYFFTKWALKFLEPLQNKDQLISLATQLKDFDEEELSSYNSKNQKAVDVLHYYIHLDLYPEEKNIIADVTIEMKVNDKNLENIDINFYDNLRITKLEINNKEASYLRTEKKLQIKNPKNKDTLKVRIQYNGTPKNIGFGSFNFEKVNGHTEIYTLNEPVFASTWIPCIDLPDDKAFVDMYIKNDSSNVSLSNGKLIDVKTIKDRKTFHWKTLYPISTYLIAVYSANYKSYSEKYLSESKDTLNISYYATAEKFEDAKKDFADHKNYIKTFEKLFGQYPFVKEKYSIAEFWWQMGAMENQTLTGVGSSFITGKKLFTDMLIHELSHHWWGDAVGPRTWKDIWLNEGFATYSVALYWEAQAGFSALQSTLHEKFGSFNNMTLYNPGNLLFNPTIYNKGAWVLHMLRKEIGDADFFNLLKQYFTKYKYSNASTDDFKRLSEQISKKKLDQFFNQWVYNGKGIIELKYSWQTQSQGKDFNTKIEIKQLQKGYDIYKFPLDIKLVFDKSEDFKISTYYVQSKDSVINIFSDIKPTQVVLDPDKWLLAEIKYKEEN